MKKRMLDCTVSLCAWLKELAFLGHVLSLGLDRLRRDAEAIRAVMPVTPQRDNAVLKELTAGLAHAEAIQRGFSPNQLIDGDAGAYDQSLNRLLLFETCAAYERWATEMADVLVLPAGVAQQLKQAPFKCKSIASAMQFPGAAVFLVAALAKVAPKSQPPGLVPLKAHFKRAIIRAKGSGAARFRTPVRFRDLLRGYLTIYRAHKELRNGLVHATVKVDAKFEAAREAYDSVKPTNIGMKELPQLVPVKAGDPATVTLRGVFGLMQVVERAATIIDGYAN